MTPHLHVVENRLCIERDSDEHVPRLARLAAYRVYDPETALVALDKLQNEGFDAPWIPEFSKGLENQISNPWSDGRKHEIFDSLYWYEWFELAIILMDPEPNFVYRAYSGFIGWVAHRNAEYRIAGAKTNPVTTKSLMVQKPGREGFTLFEWKGWGPTRTVQAGLNPDFPGFMNLSNLDMSKKWVV